MIFYSISFLIFFIVFSVAMHSVHSAKFQHVVFLAANVTFYAFWDYRFLLLLGLVIFICYGGGLLYSNCKKREVIHLSVIACLIILGVFKYFNFFSESFSKVFGINDYVSLNLVLPLGISFYLFQAMSYLFDVLYKKVEVELDFIKLAVYISFFPQITSGPIVKSKDFLPQLNRIHKIRKKNVYEGIQLILLGMTKKLVFADRIGVAVDAVYLAPVAYNGISVILTVIGYSFQIYCDFSGYSDMAIGIAKIWDFDLGENFNAPYIAKNPSDFWRRWHISLSSWFRDYVYIPLGGNRKGRFRTYFNLFITMVLSGIWHGANVTFIIWGIIHGLGSAINKAFKDMNSERYKKIQLPGWLCIILNFVFVSLAWVVFRAGNIREAVTVYRSMFNMTGLMYINIFIVVYVLLLSGFNLYSLLKNSGRVFRFCLDLDKFSSKVFLCVWAWAIVLFMYVGNSAFIYAQF